MHMTQLTSWALKTETRKDIQCQTEARGQPNAHMQLWVHACKHPSNKNVLQRSGPQTSSSGRTRRRAIKKTKNVSETVLRMRSEQKDTLGHPLSSDELNFTRKALSVNLRQILEVDEMHVVVLKRLEPLVELVKPLGVTLAIWEYR